MPSSGRTNPGNQRGVRESSSSKTSGRRGSRVGSTAGPAASEQESSADAAPSSIDLFARTENPFKNDPFAGRAGLSLSGSSGYDLGKDKGTVNQLIWEELKSGKIVEGSQLIGDGVTVQLQTTDEGEKTVHWEHWEGSTGDTTFKSDGTVNFVFLDPVEGLEGRLSMDKDGRVTELEEYPRPGRPSDLTL